MNRYAASFVFIPAMWTHVSLVIQSENLSNDRMARYTSSIPLKKYREIRASHSTGPSRTDFLAILIKAFINRRHHHGLTQEEVDVLMGNSDRLVSKWECGSRTPTSFNLYCWAETLGCSLILSEIREEKKTLSDSVI